MLAHLCAVADQQGIRAFFAEILPENRHMIEVVDSGFDVSVAEVGDAIRIEFPAAPLPPMLRHFAERAHLSVSTDPNP